MGLCGQSDHQNAQNATLFHSITIDTPRVNFWEESYYKMVILGLLELQCGYGAHLTPRMLEMGLISAP